MSEIEYTRTLGKVHQYSNIKILLLTGVITVLINPMTADAGNVLLHLAYSADIIDEPVRQ